MTDAPHLPPGAALAVLAPAWPWLLPKAAARPSALLPHRRLAAQAPALGATHLAAVGLPATLLRCRGEALTPSQAWRAGLAATLATRPPLLVLDGADLAALDPLAQAACIAALRAARQAGTALLLLTEDLNLAAALAEQGWLPPGPAQPLGRLVQAPAARALVDAARLPTLSPPPPPPNATRPALALHGVAGLPLSLGAGETLALLGDDPAGRRTLALALAGLAPPPGGILALDGHAIPWPANRRRAAELAELQLLLPDHAGPLDPKRSLRAALHHRLHSLGQPLARAAELLTACGLDPALSWQTPPQLGPEQRQRAALAVALATNPRVILSLDWTAGLPAASAAALLALLARLRGGAAWLMLGEAAPLATRHASQLAVLHQGRIVEAGAATALLARQSHPATAALLGAAAATRRLLAATVVPITAAAID